MERRIEQFSPDVHDKRNRVRKYIHYLLEDISVDDVAKDLHAEDFVSKEFDGKHWITLFDVERYIDFLTENNALDKVLNNDFNG